MKQDYLTAVLLCASVASFSLLVIAGCLIVLVLR